MTEFNVVTEKSNGGISQSLRNENHCGLFQSDAENKLFRKVLKAKRKMH